MTKLPSKIPSNSSWNHIHSIIAQINKVMLLPSFDMELFSEDNFHSKLINITTFANRKTYIEGINNFLMWYYLNILV